MKNTMVVAFILLSLTANSQITKGNWLIGGNAEFSSSKTTFSTGSSSGSNISITPKIGYFPIDKLGAGLLVSYSHNAATSNNTTSEASDLGIGPFVRYYLLPVDNRVNVLCESNLKFLEAKTNLNRRSTFTSYSVLVGPTIFFNSSAGMEMLIGYKGYKAYNEIRNSTIYMSIGFQIFLEKE